MSICNKEDDFIFEKPMWIALLSNGEKIYQDDGRPDLQIYSAWIRLSSYLKDTKLKIVDLYFRFRSNVVHILPENAEGYYFSNGVIGQLSSDFSINLFVCGEINNGVARIRNIKIPELIVMSEEERIIGNYSIDPIIMNL